MVWVFLFTMKKRSDVSATSKHSTSIVTISTWRQSVWSGQIGHVFFIQEFHRFVPKFHVNTLIRKKHNTRSKKRQEINKNLCWSLIAIHLQIIHISCWKPWIFWRPKRGLFAPLIFFQPISTRSLVPKQYHHPVNASGRNHDRNPATSDSCPWILHLQRVPRIHSIEIKSFDMYLYTYINKYIYTNITLK